MRLGIKRERPDLIGTFERSKIEKCERQRQKELRERLERAQLTWWETQARKLDE